MIPTRMDAVIPNTITGPAMENILAQSPRTIPSRLCSIAGLTMELANPVMGTMLPAPPNAPILSYTPNPVNIAVNKIIVMVTNPQTVFSSMDGNTA